MRQKLANDTFIFSGFKTYSQLKTASELLLDDAGKPKPFAQFSRDIQAIHANYNQRYLEAEYYFAQGSAQMAAKWANLDDTGRYNLQYRTAGDSRVRDSHAALRDTTLPADDSFWDLYYPPNGWRCRCQAVEVSKDRYKESDSDAAKKAGNAATTSIGKDGKNSLAIFRFNPGKQQIIFPPKHPYKGDLSKCGNVNLADGSGQDEKCKVAAELQQQLTENEFKVLKQYDNGGSLKIHSLVDTNASDYKKVYNSANHFAKAGEDVKIMPIVKDKTSSLYKNLFADLKGTKYEGKSPDFKVGKNYYEHEGHNENSNPKNWVSNMLTSGVKQSARLIIDETNYDARRLKKLIYLRQKEGQDIEELWTLSGKQLTLIYKKDKTQ